MHFYLFRLILIFVLIFSIAFIITDSVYFYFKNIKEFGKPEKIKSDFKESSFLIKLFRDFPRLMGRCLYERKNAFDDYGIIVFYGPQGCGKTMSVVHYAQQIYTKYPKSKVGSNFNLLWEDFNVKSWNTLFKIKNGNYPIVYCIDELSQWANSRDWQKMNKNVLGELCFQRKHKRLILGTAQSISQIDKQIRLQCASGEFRRCFTPKLFNFVTLVIRFRPEFDSEGNLKNKHFKGFYIYLQDEILRYSYDTLQTIGRLKDIESGE